MVLTKTHGIDMDSLYYNTHGIDLDTWYSMGTPESHTYERASVACMRDFFSTALSKRNYKDNVKSVN